MNGGQLLLSIVATALASSLLTLVMGLFVFQRWVRPRLEMRLSEFAALLEARVRAGASAAGQELLPPLREQIRGGVEEAAAELLPKLRTELTAGFQEATAESLPALREEMQNALTGSLTSLLTSEALNRAAGKVVRTGSSLVESGLNLLRATRPHDHDKPSHSKNSE